MKIATLEEILEEKDAFKVNIQTALDHSEEIAKIIINGTASLDDVLGYGRTTMSRRVRLCWMWKREEVQRIEFCKILNSETYPAIIRCC